MIINIKFKDNNGKLIETTRTEFDRNYDDEETAIIFIEKDATDTEGYYEVNVRKSEECKPLAEGYVCDYRSSDDTEPTDIINDVEIEVTLHDFDDVFAKANEDLNKQGMGIVLEYDGECYWNVGIKEIGKAAYWYAENDFDTEVGNDINEAWAHARAKIKAKKDKEIEILCAVDTDDNTKHNLCAVRESDRKDKESELREVLLDFLNDGKADFDDDELDADFEECMSAVSSGLPYDFMEYELFWETINTL